MTQNVDCVYADSQQPRIEHNTLILLERIQMLEDRLLSSPNFSDSHTAAREHATSSAATTAPAVTIDATNRPDMAAFGNSTTPPTTAEIPISLSHTANANHVLGWPIVQELLASAPMPIQEDQPTEATAVFFRQASFPDQTLDGYPPDTWRLFEGDDVLQSRSEAAEMYLDLIHAYFDEVNVFYPLISHSTTVQTLESIVAADQTSDTNPPDTPSAARYCLLLLVLCMGSFIRQRKNRINLLNPPGEDNRGFGAYGSFAPDERLWQKAQLLLGCVSSAITIEAAQCTMLARILLDPQNTNALPEALRRLYWVAFIYEGDFMSEISVTLPSGIARYEDQVPYPTRVMSPGQDSNREVRSPEDQMNGVSPAASIEDDKEELVAFQISTNAAIRRLLNRVHSMVYDSKDQFRLTRVEYVKWLLRISEDFWSYHDTIYRNIPHFLFVSQPEGNSDPFGSSPQTPGFSRLRGLSNNPWNVLRLEGRYHAAKHIIHRPFFDYALLNMEHIQTHPDRETILQKCGLCLQGCKGFFSVFDVDEVNSMTCLFATGMACVDP
ncbi:hypothetical protein ACHAQA_000351 [Verticillium albo-atrum]